MFWNSEFNLSAAPNIFENLLQSPSIELSDILFHEDLLQELKTSNLALANFLSKPEIVNELVDNICKLTEKDCYDKLLYSKVHAAYISCEILTAGSSDINDALLSQTDSLKKIISCLVKTPDDDDGGDDRDDNKKVNGLENGIDHKDKQQQQLQQKSASPSPEPASEPEPEPESRLTLEPDPEVKIESKCEPETEAETEPVVSQEQQPGQQEHSQQKQSETPSLKTIKVVPQKAALVSKLIRSIHSSAPADLSCFITKNMEIFSSFIEVLVNNIDVSGSFEILSTFISRTTPPELRFVFCEILSKLNFVFSMINVMTLSNVEDKQRNACHLLCDIIAIGRQDVNDLQHQTRNRSVTNLDMLEEVMESKEAVHLMLSQMFPQKHSKEAIVCGMKVLQTLVEKKHAENNPDLVFKCVEKIQDEIAENLIHFHELLKNPPEQEPIKTTFGVIQKPLGYIRLEVVSLIRELLTTFSPVIIRKLVELKTIKTIIDLFVEYSWNNLLHTQVEKAVTEIIRNCRRDEDLKYHIDMQKQSAEDSEEPVTHDLPSLALITQLLNECDLIFRLLYPKKEGEQANFGHIVQMINSISINSDLDSIKEHLSEMEAFAPDIYARWTNFVNVDVASFKEISLYIDVQSKSNHTHNNFDYPQKRNLSSNDDHSYYLTSLFEPNHHRSPSANNDDNVGDDQIMTYFSFTKETVIPPINVDVLPKTRRGGALH